VAKNVLKLRAFSKRAMRIDRAFFSHKSRAKRDAVAKQGQHCAQSTKLFAVNAVAADCDCRMLSLPLILRQNGFFMAEINS
jgi:hypothetical protein